MNETCEGEAFSEQNAAAITLPGAVLRQARESQGLSRERVCRELGLTCTLLEALESDDYGRMPAPVYVKGYLRRYCDLLKLRVGPVLSAYEACSRKPDTASATEGQVEGRQRRPGLMLAGSVGAAVLVCTAVFWTLYSEGREMMPADVSAGSTLEHTVDRSPENHGTHSLDFVFHQDSWVEVVDARDHILAVELRRAGSTLAVEGVPPFNIVLGNGPGVSVSYQGSPVTPVAVTKDRRAQFVVGR